ncbi:MAG: SLBB domain-containing protein [Gammaproteobacteria bacterium]
MNIKFYTKPLFLLLPLFLNAQSMDSMSGGFNETFINSLPENIRNDLIDGQMQDEAPATSTDPQTRITKLENSLQQAERSLNSIRSELNADILRRTDNSMLRFGESFFSSLQSTFQPITEPNFDGSYILDVGDELTVQLIGPSKFIKKFIINRDGTIDLPEIGKISVAKKSLKEAEAAIQAYVEEAYIGAESFVSLTNLRDMNILLVGNVVQPGLYTLQGGSSILQAIFSAGGINELGSYRSILHKRDNKVLAKIDLYKVIAFGDSSFSIPLRSGDSLVVQSKGAEISLFSESLYSAIYEVLPGETLSNILDFSGFNPARFVTKFPFNLTRADKQNRIVQEISLEQAKNFIPLHGDTFQMSSIDPSFQTQIKVKVSGEVNIPGLYAVEKGTKLSDIISLAGGYSDTAYPIGGIFLRDSVKNLEMQIRDKAYYDLINFVSASPSFASSAAPQGLLAFLSALKDYEPSGRVTTEFNINNLKSNPEKNFYLEDNDEIIIPIFKPQIFVFGEVLNPGAVSFAEGKSLDFYLRKSGGVSRLADDKRIVIIQPNGETISINNDIFGLFRETEYLLPGATIYVPKFIGKIDGIQLAGTISPIVSSFALSLASLNSIN